VIIQPGQEFSFNTTLGIVDGSTGYRKELVIKPEGTLPEFGGGLCQVSTTMYRAILFAGLPVTDRAPHSYAVSYYSQVLGHGLDATIYLGGQDLKFTNDTGYPILVHTYTVDDYELYFDFYGTADGRSVELEGPKIYGHTKSGPTEYIETDQVAPRPNQAGRKGSQRLLRRLAILPHRRQWQNHHPNSPQRLQGGTKQNLGRTWRSSRKRSDRACSSPHTRVRNAIDFTAVPTDSRSTLPSTP
jgi:vancomycin resistance protein YoaR